MELSARRIWLHGLTLDEAQRISRDPDAFAQGLGARCAEEWPSREMREALGTGALTPAGADGFGVWVVVERANTTVIGDIGFHGPPDDQGRAEIGYAIAPSWRRRGYATEAVATLVSWARSMGGVTQIAAHTLPDNEASQSVLRRLHFGIEPDPGGEILWLLGVRGAGEV
jgi:RimJ/RimL family protein N-acetyltransferase